MPGGGWSRYPKPLGFWQGMGNLRSGDFPKLIQHSTWGQRSRRFPPGSLPSLGNLPAESLSHAHPFSMLMPPTAGTFGLPVPPCVLTQSWYRWFWAPSAPQPSTGDLPRCPCPQLPQVMPRGRRELSWCWVESLRLRLPEAAGCQPRPACTRYSLPNVHLGADCRSGIPTGALDEPRAAQAGERLLRLRCLAVLGPGGFCGLSWAGADCIPCRGTGRITPFLTHS